MTAEKNAAVITAFCNAWGEGDLDTILGSFAEGAVYHNIPMKPIEGNEAIAKVIGKFLKGGPVVFETTHQVASDTVVMNERIDYLPGDGSNKKALPVMGVFEMSDGKITAWRDYFDMAMMSA